MCREGGRKKGRKGGRACTEQNMHVIILIQHCSSDQDLAFDIDLS